MMPETRRMGLKYEKGRESRARWGPQRDSPLLLAQPTPAFRRPLGLVANRCVAVFLALANPWRSGFLSFALRVRRLRTFRPDRLNLRSIGSARNTYQDADWGVYKEVF